MVIAAVTAAVAIAGGQVNLSPADNGRTISVRPGRAVVVTLPSNASTGFRWQLLQQPDGAVLRLDSHSYLASKSKLLGAAGTEVWRFRAVRKGSVTLRLGYARPSQPADVEQRFSVRLRVSP